MHTASHFTNMYGHPPHAAIHCFRLSTCEMRMNDKKTGHKSHMVGHKDSILPSKFIIKFIADLVFPATGHKEQALQPFSTEVCKWNTEVL